jgi:hypothetical protein
MADFYIAPDDPNDPNMPQALRSSPVQLEELPVLMDRFTVRPVEQAQQGLTGLININTAPRRVLLVVPGMTTEAADAILGGRSGDPATLRTTAWPLVSGAVDAATFKQIAPYITTKAYQFHVEIVGYGDHTALSRRFEWIIEMLGPLMQVRYQRELTALGPAWPLDQEQTQVTQQR